MEASGAKDAAAWMRSMPSALVRRLRAIVAARYAIFVLYYARNRAGSLLLGTLRFSGAALSALDFPGGSAV